MSWERTELHEDKPPDWEEELNVTINELHQEHDVLPVSWEHKWEWLQSGEDYPRSYHDKEEVEIYYSDKEESKIYYSDTESMLGAAGEDDSDENTSSDKEPRHSRTTDQAVGTNLGSNTTNAGVSGTTLGLLRNANTDRNHSPSTTSRPTTSRRRTRGRRTSTRRRRRSRSSGPST